MAPLKSINQDDLRNHNLSVVLDTMLRSVSPMSRAELAKTTGLTKATMSLLAPMLIDGGAVREGEPSSVTAYGRPSTPLAVRGGGFCGMGLQINTDGYGFIVLDLTGHTVVGRWASESMEDRDPDEIFSRLDDLVVEGEQVIRERGMTLAGCGLALPGLVTDDMRLLTARNLGWEELDLGRFAVVNHLHPRPGNEANMAALAQIPGFATQRHGDGAVGPSDSFLYISTDIGIGGAIVRRGKVVDGDHGFAGELGHVSVALDGPVCRFGRRGCLESYAGRRALVETAGIARGRHATRAEAVDELMKRWHDGDGRVIEAMNSASAAMASCVASAINILDVGTVMLGGLWDRFGMSFATGIEDRINPQLLGAPQVRAHVLLPEVNVQPALRGAAKVGLRAFIDRPLDFLAPSAQSD